MRVEIPSFPQSSIEAPKVVEKLGVRKSVSVGQEDREQSFIASPPAFGGTYSVSSLKAAVDYYAKYLTVAESNLEAADHGPGIPQLIVDRFRAS